MTLLAMVLMAGCSGDDSAEAPKVSSKDIPESFTFFNVGAGSRLDETVRDALKKQLGSDAIETRGTIDLTLVPKELLHRRFPDLYQLHRDLNNDFRARVEHDITRLTYRYPWRENTPFIFVRMVFANDTRLPLYFRMTLNKQGDGVVNTLEEKYGPPRTVIPDDGDRAVLAWEKNGDVLVVSRMKNRLGDPEYHLMFYFAANLKTLRDTEERLRRQQEAALEKAGKRAF